MVNLKFKRVLSLLVLGTFILGTGVSVKAETATEPKLTKVYVEYSMKDGTVLAKDDVYTMTVSVENVEKFKDFKMEYIYDKNVREVKSIKSNYQAVGTGATETFDTGKSYEKPDTNNNDYNVAKYSLSRVNYGKITGKTTILKVDMVMTDEGTVNLDTIDFKFDIGDFSDKENVSIPYVLEIKNTYSSNDNSTVIPPGNNGDNNNDNTKPPTDNGDGNVDEIPPTDNSDGDVDDTQKPNDDNTNDDVDDTQKPNDDGGKDDNTITPDADLDDGKGKGDNFIEVPQTSDSLGTHSVLISICVAIGGVCLGLAILTSNKKRKRSSLIRKFNIEER